MRYICWGPPKFAFGCIRITLRASPRGAPKKRRCAPHAGLMVIVYGDLLCPFARSFRACLRLRVYLDTSLDTSQTSLDMYAPNVPGMYIGPTDSRIPPKCSWMRPKCSLDTRPKRPGRAFFMVSDVDVSFHYGPIAVSTHSYVKMVDLRMRT